MASEIEKTIKPSAYIGIGLALFFILLSFMGPHGEVFTKPMSSTLFLIAAAMCMWISECIPILAASLLIIVLMPLIGIRPSLTAALGGFTSTATYFVIASIALGHAISKTRIPSKLLARMLRWSKGKISRILLSFLIIPYLISMWVSDMGAVVLALAFVSAFSGLIKSKIKNSKNLLTMLGLSAPIGAVLGGNSNVVGSSVNIVTINMLHNYSGRTITFFEWMIMGLPACLVTMLLIWRVLLLVFKTEDLSEEDTRDFADQLDQYKTSLKYEGVTIALILMIMFTWFSSSWIKGLDLTTIGIFGMALLFIPRFGAISWQEFRTTMSWEVPFMGACAIGLGEAVRDVGLATLMATKLSELFPSVGLVGMTLMFSIALTILVMGIPVGPAMAAMMTVPGYILAEKLGLNPMANVMVVGIFAANSSILPLNATFLVPYSRGYFGMKDCMKAGLCLSLLWVIISTVWLPLTTTWLYPMK
jgi:sodium-dependent dicarboxylate transporter 2/3/5